jgi:hypothetical protein
MGTCHLPLLVLLLLHIGCAPQNSERAARTPGPRQATPGAAVNVSRATAATPSTLPTTVSLQDVVDLQVNSVASASVPRAFRLRERAKVWMVAPACPAAGIVPILRQSEREVARIGEATTIELASGVYSLTFAMPSAEVNKRSGSCTAFLQVHFLTDVSCTMEVARFGVLPFDLETPSIESIGDLNADGLADYKVTFSASPSQVATRVTLSQEPPECARTVFEGVGHAVALNESRKGWRRLYFVDTQYLASTAPKWLVRTHGSSWAVTWPLDYEPASRSYLKGPVPIRCERTDGVQRVFGDPVASARAALIPPASCQPKYWEFTNEIP